MYHRGGFLAYRRRRRVWQNEQWWFAILNVVGALSESVDCHAGFTQLGIVLGPAFHRGVIPRERTTDECEICRLTTHIAYIQCMYDPV